MIIKDLERPYPLYPLWVYPKENNDKPNQEDEDYTPILPDLNKNPDISLIIIQAVFDSTLVISLV